jgi:hypothetical protein
MPVSKALPFLPFHSFHRADDLRHGRSAQPSPSGFASFPQADPLRQSAREAHPSQCSGQLGS